MSRLLSASRPALLARAGTNYQVSDGPLPGSCYTWRHDIFGRVTQPPEPAYFVLLSCNTRLDSVCDGKRDGLASLCRHSLPISALACRARMSCRRWLTTPNGDALPDLSYRFARSMRHASANLMTSSATIPTRPTWRVATIEWSSPTVLPSPTWPLINSTPGLFSRR